MERKNDGRKNKMMNLEQLRLLAQLVDSIDIAADKLDKAYEKKDSEKFYMAKKTILGFQKAMEKQIKENPVS